ncbi:MAG: YtxH domain-containing protein [Elusimicrobia bacterium]|nr:YtxH domain-containing protein [Elusimicrobiota bacterium]
MRHRQRNERKLEDDLLVDEALEESFPASDAPSYNRGLEPGTGFARPDELKWTSMGGVKAMRDEEKKTSSFAYLIGGLVVGAVVGLLFAPKKGSELIEDIGDWGRDTKERGRELYSRAKEYIPHRARSVPESIRAAREAGEKAYDRVKDKAERYEV